MKKAFLFITLLAVLVLTPIVRADIVVIATDSCRTELSDGDNGDGIIESTVNRADSNKLSVRGDAKAMKSWIKFDLSGIDVSSLTEAYLRVTLYQNKSSSCSVSAVNDDYLDNIDWTSSDLTWNNAPGNISSADGINPDDTGYSTDSLQEDLIDSATTLVGTIDYSGGTSGTSYLINVLSILQADSDGIVQFVLHDAGGSTNFATLGSSLGTDADPALVLVPEPTTMLLLGLGSLIASRRSRK